MIQNTKLSFGQLYLTTNSGYASQYSNEGKEWVMEELKPHMPEGTRILESDSENDGTSYWFDGLTPGLEERIYNALSICFNNIQRWDYKQPEINDADKVDYAKRVLSGELS